MSENEKKTRLSLRELFESLVRVLESGRHEVRAGRVKDLGGIKGVHMEYFLSLKPLTDKSVKEFREHEHLHKPPREICPLIDILGGGNNLIIVAELPGVKEDEIKLDVEGNILTISADTPTGKYHKEVPLPNPVKTDFIETAYNNGVLEVKLKKAR
jgi:HSP20 family protein